MDIINIIGPVNTSPYSNQCNFKSHNYKDRNGVIQPTFIIKGNHKLTTRVK